MAEREKQAILGALRRLGGDKLKAAEVLGIAPSTLYRKLREYEDEEKEMIVSIAEVEKKAILEAIQELGGDKLMAAKLLGIGKTTLYRKLKEYGIVTEPDMAHENYASLPEHYSSGHA